MTTEAVIHHRQTQPIFLRWMRRDDWPRVLEIEDACFQWDAWTEHDLRSELRIPNVIGYVAEMQEQLVGFYLYELRRDHMKIIDLAVDPAWQRRGIGAQMLDRMQANIRNSGRSRIYADVRETNLAAQCLLRDRGFLWRETLPFTEDELYFVMEWRK